MVFKNGLNDDLHLILQLEAKFIVMYIIGANIEKYHFCIIQNYLCLICIIYEYSHLQFSEIQIHKLILRLINIDIA